MEASIRFSEDNYELEGISEFEDHNFDLHWNNLFPRVKRELQNYPDWIVAESVAKSMGLDYRVQQKWGRTYLVVDFPGQNGRTGECLYVIDYGDTLDDSPQADET